MMSKVPKLSDGQDEAALRSAYSDELELGAIGLWHIVPRGQSLGYSGAALQTYVEEGVAAILDVGGVVVRHVPQSGYEWTHQRQYGESRDEIVKSVVAEWLSLPDDTMVLIEEAPWFVRPDANFPKVVKMD